MRTKATKTMSRDIPITAIDPDPDQPRKHFGEDGLAGLAHSMAEVGLASPIMVRPCERRFVIVHGERRWRAATSLNWETIPAIVRDLNIEESHWISLAENVARSDLTPLEEATAFQSHLTTGVTQEELGRRIGKSQSYVAQKLRLLTLPAPIRSYLASGALSEGHVRALLRLRKVYGTDDAGNELRRSFDPPESGIDYRDRRSLFSLFRCIRPEDNPPYWIGNPSSTKPPSPALTVACHAFDDWLEAEGGSVPAWAVAAFWWASLAVCVEGSVANLTLSLDRWRERLYGAVVMSHLHNAGPPTDPARAMEWWGYRSDLRHAGLAFDALSSEIVLSASEAIMTVGSAPLPSSLQRWGFEHDRYQSYLRRGGIAP